MTRRVKQLARMDPAEIRWRVRTRGRAIADRVATRIANPAWKRTRLAGALAPLPALDPVRSALLRRDWQRAHHELARHFASEPQRFVIGPGGRPRVVNAIRRACPDGSRHAAESADRVVAGEYDLLGYRRLRFDPAPADSAGAATSLVDWHLDPVHGRRAPRVAWSAVPFLDPSCGDHKVIWELNRHQHWLMLGRASWLTGDVKYRDRWLRELADWLDSNPPLLGINWASMLELAMRSLSWTWALNLFVDGGDAFAAASGPWLVDLLLALDRQLAHVERHLSRYFSPNTHLLGEALALYVCGSALPQLAGSRRRADVGRAILLAEIERQIGADGGHLERSTHYHRYTFDFYLLALLVSRINGDPAAARFAPAVSRLADAARLLADDGGRLPHIGDDDGGMLLPLTGRRPDDIRDSLAAAALLLGRPDLSVGGAAEEVLWLLAHDAFADMFERASAASRTRPVRPASGALEQTGYHVSRSGGHHLVIDGGAHGYQNGGHAHADALSMTLSVRGLPLLIDSGTACYTSDAALRDRFRSTASHNTLTIDARPSSIASGPFHWAETADSRVHRWRTGGTFDYFDGQHDGYRPLVHRRHVLALHHDLLIVADLVGGSGVHDIALHWHIDPDWSVRAEGSRAVLVRAGRRIDFLVADAALEVFRADSQSGLGWYSPEYGRVETATTLRGVRRATLPLWMVSVIGLDPCNAIQSATPVPARANRALAHATAIRVARRLSTDFMLIAEPAAAPDPTLSASAVTGTPAADLETDARMLFYRTTAGRGVTRLALVDGSFVRAVAEAGPRLELPRRAPHHVASFERAARASGPRLHQEQDDTPCVA